MKTGTTGTGPSLRIPANKGATISRTTDSRLSSSTLKAPQAQSNSQRGTTAPAVSMPGVTLVKDTKPRTNREQLVDAYNGQAGRKQAPTVLEKEMGTYDFSKLSGTQTGYRKNKAQ